MNNVENVTVQNNLCVSCGICKAVCYRNCIDYIRIKGQYVPQVNKNLCIQCDNCLDVCPGHEVDLHKLYLQEHLEEPEDFYVGNHKSCCIANAKDYEIRNNGVSGGCITAIINELLVTGRYDMAFLIDSYEYNSFLEAKPYKCGDSLTATSKSRYVPVSHNKTVEYMLTNKEKKLLL